MRSRIRWIKATKGLAYNVLEFEMIHGCPARSQPARPHRNRQPASRLGAVAAAEPPLGVWDHIHRDYRAAHPNEPLPEAIRRETGISPTDVAEGICAEASAWLNEPLPGDWIPELVEHAEQAAHWVSGGAVPDHGRQ